MPSTSTRKSSSSRHSGVFGYYPFGMMQQGRQFVGGMGYRYGFGAQESDNEVSGRGNSYTAEFWQYDCRLGRRWNLDPVPQISLSDYSVNGNNPILNIDPNGAYFFGLFGSTKEQRQSAEYTASRLGGKVNNLHSKSISVRYFTHERSHDESGLVTIKAIGHVIGFDKNGNSTNRYGIRTEYNWRHEYVISRKIANGHLVNVGTVEVPQFVATGKLDDPEIDPVTLAIGIPALARAFINSSATVAIGRASADAAKTSAKTGTNVYKHIYKYAERVRMRAVQDPVSHNFPYSFDDIILSTNPIIKKNGYRLFQQAGTMNGKNGVFEIGLTKNGIIDHRFFRPIN